MQKDCLKKVMREPEHTSVARTRRVASLRYAWTPSEISAWRRAAKVVHAHQLLQDAGFHQPRPTASVLLGPSQEGPRLQVGSTFFFPPQKTHRKEEESGDNNEK